MLKKHGHYHITEEFLITILHYTELLEQAGVFSETDYEEMAGSIAL